MTRAFVSLSRSFYDRLKAASVERGISMSSIVEAAVADVTSPGPASSTTTAHVASAAQGGDLVRAPENQEVGSSRRSPTNFPAPAVRHAIAVTANGAPVHVAQSLGTCAICTNYGPGAPEKLDGREVFVCVRCTEEHPIYGGYDAGGVGRPTVHGVTRGGREVGCTRKGAHD